MVPLLKLKGFLAEEKIRRSQDGNKLKQGLPSLNLLGIKMTNIVHRQSSNVTVKNQVFRMTGESLS